MSYFAKRAVRVLLVAALLPFANAAWAQSGEVTGTVEEVGADYLVVDDTRFVVSTDTEFEESGGVMRVLEVEKDDDGEGDE